MYQVSLSKQIIFSLPYNNLHQWTMCWGPYDHASFNDLLGLTGLSRQSPSQLEFITAKRYKAQSAKGKNAEGKPRGNQIQACKSLLPAESQTTIFMKWSSLETQYPGFSLGAAHLGTLCLAHTKSPDSQKENSQKAFSINHMTGITRLGTVSHSDQGMMRTVPKSNFPVANQ